MKSRPTFSTFLIPARSNCMFARAQLQSRNIYLQPSTLRSNTQWIRRSYDSTSRLIRCASTSAATSKTRHNTQPPPASSKTSKQNTQAKPNKPLPPAKLSTLSTPTPSNVPSKRTATPTSPETTTTLVLANEKLNPPTFTYAPELSVPARKAGQNYASYLFSCGKAYLSFYKSGISHTRQTLKFAKTLRARIADQGKGVSVDIAGAGILSRAEWQVLRRSKRDLLRLPVMGFLILALGEWLPLVVVYLTPVIPEACRIPTQVQRTLKKLEDRRKDRLSRIGDSAHVLQARDRTPRTDENAIRLAAAAEGLLSPSSKVGKSGGIPMAEAIIPPEASTDLSLFHLLLLSARLNAHPRLIDTLRVTPPKWLLQRNVSQTLAYLVQDDTLIKRDGGSAALGEKELQRACVDRGIDVLGKSEGELRRALGAWYKM